MKKTVIIFIAIIYVFTIAVVGFIGVQARVFDEAVYVSDIVVTPDEKLVATASTEGIDYRYKIDYADNLSFQFTCRALPSNTSWKELNLVVLSDKDECTVNKEFDGVNNIYTIGYNLNEGGTTLSFKVSSMDGNKNMFKNIDVYVKY